MDILDLLHSLYLGEDEIGIAAYAHSPPCLIVVVIFLEHQFQCLLCMLVVECQGFLRGNVYFIHKAFLKLDQSDDPIVDQSNEFRTDSFLISRERIRFALMNNWSVNDDGRKIRQEAP